MEGLRRIVTGHNTDGKSIIMIDGPPARSIGKEIGGLFEIWNTDGNQINTLDEIDRADTDVLLSPPKGGTKFRYFAINPIPEGVPKEKLEELAAIAFAEIGASQDRVDTTRHPGMHKTKTIDYIILLKGNVTLLLDDDEVQLKPFDVVVQRGTNHAWVNNGKEPALFIAVLIDSDLKD
ncbi:cupin domain-containing protein [Okeania sp. SIO3B5]|uniref:cupin domain-containing protein n=1 Tax=Okeania sp. SIO3B5 TaxID=2607811 RepID=UPI0025EF2274|nr:cupin domain-containing protein [Okeania sp. SIO3B5]